MYLSLKIKSLRYFLMLNFLSMIISPKCKKKQRRYLPYDEILENVNEFRAIEKSEEIQTLIDSENRIFHYQVINLLRFRNFNTHYQNYVTKIDTIYVKNEPIYLIYKDTFMDRMPFILSICDNTTIFDALLKMYYKNLMPETENQNFINYSKNIEIFFELFFFIDILKINDDYNKELKKIFWVLVQCFHQHYKLSKRLCYSFRAAYNNQQGYFLYKNEYPLKLDSKLIEIIKKDRKRDRFLLKFYGLRISETCAAIDLLIAKILTCQRRSD